MQERYRIYQRGGKNFYAKDTKTGRAFSLSTSDEREALRLVAAKNQSSEQPCLNVAMARVYLSAQSPEFTKRTWGQLIELVAQGYEGSTAVRWRKFAKSAPLKVLASLPIYQTEAVHILAVLDQEGGRLDQCLAAHPPQSRLRPRLASCPCPAQETLAQGQIQGAAGHHRCRAREGP